MGAAISTKADWYPDPHGGSGVRWWDGDRWTEDTRAEHPRGAPAPASTPPSVTPPPPMASGGPSPVGRARLVVARQWRSDSGTIRLAGARPRPRPADGLVYVLSDPDGTPLGTAVERAPVLGGRVGDRAETLDVYDAAGGAVLRLTKDRHLLSATAAAAGWNPIAPWGYVVLGPEMQPVAWAQAPMGSHQGWAINVLGAPAPIGIRDQKVGTRRGAPRPVTMGGSTVAQIALTSGTGGPDTYVLDLLHGPAEGGLATTFVALVLMYDQIFRVITPLPRRSSDAGTGGWGAAGWSS